MQFRTTFYTSGLFGFLMAAVMILPAMYDYDAVNHNNHAFLLSSAICLFVSGVFYFSNRPDEQKNNFTIKEGFFLTTFVWCYVCLFGALPFFLSNFDVSFTDAVFESVSGMTTTGSTVFYDLDHKPRGFLLWRSILQWLGGIGIVAFAIVILPFLKVGGMQLFKTESSDKSDKLFPKSADVILSIVLSYSALTLACAILYHHYGMGWYEAMNHALTTLSTGGFSTHDASFGFYQQDSLRIIATFFMILGSVPFVLYAKWVTKGKFDFFKDEQVRAFLFFIAAATSLIVLYHILVNDEAFLDVIVTVLFHIVSIITTTGYALGDYSEWGPFAVGVFFFLTYLGGCAGSTAGGAKTIRLVIAYHVMKHQLKKILYPHGVFQIRFQGDPVEMRVIQSVMFFGGVYVFCNVALILILSLLGLDFMTAFSGAATAIANVGPGLGDVIGPSGNFSGLSDAVKWTLVAGMLMGRLEIITVIIIFVPFYWKQ